MIALNFKITQNMNVIVPKIFIANKMIPLAIQADETDKSGRTFKILFKITQDIDESEIFFEIRYKCEDNLDLEHITGKSLYIENLKKDPDKFNSFKEIMKDFSPNNFYVGSLDFMFEDGNSYIDSVKQLIDKNTGAIYYESMRIYIPRYMHIMLSLYSNNIMDPFTKEENEIIFVAPNMREMRFEKAENVKLLATCKKDIGDGNFLYNSMYEFSNGPTTWKFTYGVITPEDLELREPLDSKKFDGQYSAFEGKYIDTIRFNNIAHYVVIREGDKIKTIVTHNSLIEKTNLVDPYTIFKNENEVVIDPDKENENFVNSWINNTTPQEIELKSDEGGDE